MEIRKGRSLTLSLSLGLALFLGVTQLVTAMPRIYIAAPPPAPIVEVRPVAPSRNHVWVEGFHRWDGNAYVWTPGTWTARPRAHAAWVKGHYVHSRHGWYWVDGRWR